MLYHAFHISSWLSLFIMVPLTCCSTICLLQVLSLFLYLWSIPNVCVLNGNEGVRIPCYAYCIQMQHFNLCMYLGELPHFIEDTILWWSLEFDSLGILCFEWYYGSDDSMFVHFILQCKLSSFVHKPWGASSYYLEQSSWSYHNIYLSFGIFFVVHLVACFICWSFLTLLSFCNLWSYL